MDEELRAVRVRAADRGDAVAIAAIYEPFVVMTPVSFEDVAPAPDEIERRMSAAPRLPWLVVESAGEVVGYAYASAHRARAAYRWSVDTSIYLSEDARGRGIGRLLYQRLLAEVSGLGYVSAFAGITQPNPASVGLHEALGFRPIGIYPSVGYKAGDWHDVGWWGLSLTSPQLAPPVEPREWSPS